MLFINRINDFSSVCDKIAIASHCACLNARELHMQINQNAQSLQSVKNWILQIDKVT